MVEKEYKMDLHIHTREDITHKTLKYSLRDVIKKAFDNNYKILGFTFHDSTIRHDVEKYFKKGLLLVPGIELTIDNRHILLYSKKFNKYGRSYNYYRNFDKLEKIKDDSLLIGAPHPFYPANYSLRKKTEEYKNYIRFLENEWKKETPLFYKTYPDTIGFKWLGPLKTWLHVIRNFYQPLAIVSGIIMIGLVLALLIRGELTLPLIVIIAAAFVVLWTAKRGLDWGLDRGFRKRVNIGAYGNPVRPDEGFKKPQKIKPFRWLYWGTIFAVKIFWNTVVFYYLLIAHYELWGATWAPLLGININLVLVVGLWLPFILFFFLDIFSLFYLEEAVTGYFYGKYIGLGIIKKEWEKNVLKDLLIARIKDRFIPKELNLSPEKQTVVVAEIINHILDTLLEEDMITEEEWRKNRWYIEREEGASFYEAEVRPSDYFFSGKKVEGFGKIPYFLWDFGGFRNKTARLRIYRFLNSLLMDMPPVPVWEMIRSLTVMIPVAPGENILYTYEELNEKLNTGLTVLTYLIRRYPDEWENFVNRMIREGKFSGQDDPDFINILNLKWGEPLNIANDELKMEIRMWASCRVQPFARTLRGVIHYVGALRFYAQINHPEWDKEKITKEVGKKFQMLWGTYYRLFQKVSAFKHFAEEMEYLMKYCYDKYDFIIAADECYAEIYADDLQPPVGLLQACMALGQSDYRRCIVFHSLSKRSNAPGLRAGFVAGDADIIAKFLLYRTYHGCAMPVAVQAASIAAWEDETHVATNRALYRQKFDAVMEILAPVMPVTRPPAGFYLWAQTPISDIQFARELFIQQNVTVLPGSFLSRTVNGINPGQNRIRIALVAALEECVEAVHRISSFIKTFCIEHTQNL